MNRVPMIHTKEGITVILFNKPYSVASTDKHFEDVAEAIAQGFSEEWILDIFESVAKKVQAAVSNGIEYNGGIVTYKGEQLHGYAVEKLVSFFELGYDVTPLTGFLEKLQANPSKSVIDHLYAFLEHGKIPLTQNGNFVAYKAVREDYKDIHSGTMDNSIGQTVSIARNKVDDRRDVTCSTGLHVCSYDYLPNFTHADGHVLLVEVNPAHVVAIPSDYNNTKMRVSQYTVIGEVDGYYKENVNFLASTPVYEETYEVWGAEEGDDILSYEMDYQSFEAARDDATDLVNKEGYDEAQIRNEEGVILFTIKNGE